MRDDPELTPGMKDDGDVLKPGGSDEPVAAEQFDGVILGAAALEIDGEMQIAERARRSGGGSGVP